MCLSRLFPTPFTYHSHDLALIASSWEYDGDYVLSAATTGLNKYGIDHALSARFVLNTPLGLFVSLLCAKVGRYALSLSCVLSKLLQSLTFCSKLFFQIFVNFPPKHFNFLLLNPASQKLK